MLSIQHLGNRFTYNKYIFDTLIQSEVHPTNTETLAFQRIGIHLYEMVTVKIPVLRVNFTNMFLANSIPDEQICWKYNIQHQTHTAVTLINVPVSFSGALSLIAQYVNSTALLQPTDNILYNQTIAFPANISQEQLKYDSESYTNETS
jgi:hypothetical protein